jgi:hypothetical protein
MILNIDKDFRDLISPLTKEEFEQLENNIIAEGGIHDPIITWNNIIIDGHNRYDICIKNDLKYFTKELDLIDRNQAINWIIDNQLGRRNLAPWQQSILRGKRYNAEKKEHGGDRKSSDQIDHLKTSEKLADQYGVSAPTIRRDGNFAIAAEKASEVLEQPVMQLTKQQILEVAKEIQREKKDEKKSNQLSKDRENVIASSSTIPKLYKMDAMEFLNKISMFDLLLTDPPYSTDIDNIDEFANNWVPLALSKIKNHGRAYIFIGALEAINSNGKYIYPYLTCQAYVSLDQSHLLSCGVARTKDIFHEVESGNYINRINPDDETGFIAINFMDVKDVKIFAP